MLRKLLALAGTLLLAANGASTDYESMNAEQQLASVTILAETYEEVVPQIIELRDEIDKQVVAYQSNYYIPEEVVDEVVEDEEFFWQLKPLPR